MWKVSNITLHNRINSVLQSSKDRGQSDTKESVLIQLGLQMNKTPKKVCFMNHCSHQHVCIFGDEKHCAQAKNLGIPNLNLNELQEIEKSTKRIDKLTEKYVGFLVSNTVCKYIPNKLGHALYKANKIPRLLNKKDCIVYEIELLRQCIEEEINKLVYMSTVVGVISDPTDKLANTVTKSTNSLLATLKISWYHVKLLTIHSTYGVSHVLYLNI